MHKYNIGVYGVDFNENDDYYNVTFYNSLNIKEPNSTKFIDEFNNSNRAEITIRNSRGLLEIKDFLSQMSIKTEMFVQNNLVFFSLNFDKYRYNENSNS